MMKKLLLVIVTLLLQGCSVFGIRSVELLDYRILEKEGEFDIRMYEDYWVVRTESDGDYKSSTNKSFGRLFEYITGNNQQQKKIAMTGPVIQQNKGEKIAMTGPVIQQKSGDRRIMEFVLPAKYNKTVPPKPIDPLVTIEKISGYKAAAIGFSGNLSEEKVDSKTIELLNVIKQKGLQPQGEAFSAGYDPPWTIPFLKRNEVLIRVE